MTDSPLEDPALAQLIGKAMELIDQHGHVDLAMVCGDRWDLIDAVRESLDLAGDLANLSNGDPDRRDVERVISSRYRLEGSIGAGAMGIVYRAFDLELSRPVAVKILRAAILGPKEAQARFLREGEAMAAIHHAAVATVFDRGTTQDGETYIVMELLDGVSLSTICEVAESRSKESDDSAWIASALQCDNLPERSMLRTAVTWMLELAGGLHAAHEAGIIHRDIKPSNIHVRGTGQPVLLDFGIAASEQHATITREGGALGTPAYMAPETLNEGHKPNRAVDIYGLCATLYHLVTARAPFRGTPSQVLTSLRKREPVPAFRLRPGLPRDLQAILDKGMARSPKGRYATADRLAQDLQAFLEFRPVSARPISQTRRIARRVRRSPVAKGATATLGLLALGALGAGWWQHLQVQQLERYRVAAQPLPANTTLVDFPYRRPPNEQERQSTLAILDRMVAVAPSPFPALAYRSAYRHDQGDLRGAKADMTALAAQVDSVFCRAVAERFARIQAPSSSAKDLSLASLPKPRTAIDTVFAAYLHYRIRERDEARRLLADPRLKDDLAAEDLRMLLDTASITSIKKLADRLAPAVELDKRVARHERRLGRTTAQTAHITSFALLIQRRYADCLAASRRGLELSKWSYPMNLNAAQSARRTGQASLVVQHLQAAIELRPQYLKPRRTLFLHWIEQDRFDQAAQTLAAMPFTEAPRDQFRKHQMRGHLASKQALSLYVEGHAEQAQDRAAAACGHYEQADRIAEFRDKGDWEIAKAIKANAPDRIFGLLLQSVATDPLNWRRLKVLAAWTPDQLDHAATSSLGDYLRALIHDLSRGTSK